MEEETSFVVVDGVVVPESALLRRERGKRYGSVPGLPDEELADPEELERHVHIEEFGPILALPIKGAQRGVRPAIDETGGVDWGAFGTVDFERSMLAFDKARYKEERLREKLKDVLIMAGTATRHVRVDARRLVLRHLRQGTITLDDIADSDMLALARLHLRIWRIQDEIARLRGVRAKRQQEEFARTFG
ncbi:MAG: hypothetical protein KAY37_12550 [Phycisphaerae bacterium]|nr:hypothetical protein [Phycisphaerae bacterium]